MLCALLLALVATDPKTGPWSARLDSPGGPLPFELDLVLEKGTLSAIVTNGSEHLAVAVSRPKPDEIVFEFPDYDARLTATLDATGTKLDGEWRKRAGPDVVRRLPFHATAVAAHSRAIAAGSSTAPKDIAGRWRVAFAKDAEPAVAIFTGGPATQGAIEGTFLTATGDLRYLAGTYAEHMVLTCFDGAHAFLFTGDLQEDGTLKGAFSAGDSWTDTWTATRDPKAALSDEMAHAHWNDAFGLAQLQYPDFDGNLVSLGDPRFSGRVRILQLTGSWCPNCQDESAFLSELDKTYRDKGLAITALCFEVTGERERDTAMAKRMLARHGAQYLGLLAGRSDKDVSSQALPALDRVFAFPTTVFLHRDGRVRAVHSGFSGPATGEDHVKLRAHFTQIVDELLAEPAPQKSASEQTIVSDLWRDERARALVTFKRADDGRVSFESMELVRFGQPTRTDPIDAGDATFDGDTVHMGRTLLHYDERAHVLLDPSDCAHRLTPGARSPFPFVDGIGYSRMEQILEGLTSTDVVRRRESVYYLALQIVQDRMKPKQYGGGVLDPGLANNLLPLVGDADPLVRATASWAAGVVELADAVPTLVKNLTYGFAPVRRESARALGYLKHKPALDALLQLAHDDIDPLVRQAAETSAKMLRTP